MPALSVTLAMMQPKDAWMQWFQGRDYLWGLLFAGICLLLLFLACIPRLRTRKRVSHLPVLEPVQVEGLLLGSGALVVDLRNDAAFHAGHIRGSMHVPFAQLSARFRAPKKGAKRAIILVDEDNEVSHQAMALLQSLGFDWLYVLKGGMRAWRRDSRPISR